MLGLNFKLTPPQTELLLIIANEVYKDTNGIVTPDWDSSYFVSSGQRLISKGLVTHSMSQSPTWQPTEEGKAVAKLIEGQCERMLEYRKKANTVNGKKKRKKATAK